MAREERIRELGEALSSLDRENDALRSEADHQDEATQQIQQQLAEKVVLYT